MYTTSMPALAICQYCSKSFAIKPYRLRVSKTVFCSVECANSARKTPFAVYVRRFFAQVHCCDHGPLCPYCCWPWRGPSTRGYGQYRRPDRCRNEMAHRLAWELHQGSAIPHGLFCCHWCHNRACVNPLHLFLGTPRANTQHSARAGRLKGGANHTHGHQRASAKLTPSDVATIRLLYAHGQRGWGLGALAQAFGVTKRTIRLIVHYEMWTHLP